MPVDARFTIFCRERISRILLLIKPKVLSQCAAVLSRRWFGLVEGIFLQPLVHLFLPFNGAVWFPRRLSQVRTWKLLRLVPTAEEKDICIAVGSGVDADEFYHPPGRSRAARPFGSHGTVADGFVEVLNCWAPNLVFNLESRSISCSHF
ncbi:hypothetical protein RRG08_047889 [Elysia crispata]|uniref:Uncharacterized protein n=1 Tax=Elysia crispata TaxID=231223 RepID=A0AAE0ZLU3_9GAST|nr:hypothetical protein RRG08_047889 [Elysia crispata]